MLIVQHAGEAPSWLAAWCGSGHPTVMANTQALQPSPLRFSHWSFSIGSSSCCMFSRVGAQRQAMLAPARDQEHCVIEKLSRFHPGCPRYRRQCGSMRTVAAEETCGNTWYLNPVFLIWLFYAWISCSIACFCVFSEAPAPYLTIGSTRHCF
jgi:hypothetical protein